jgi:hypothetical protein
MWPTHLLLLLLPGDMDDLLELLFPDEPQLGAAHLADMEPAALRAHLATRGELAPAAPSRNSSCSSITSSSNLSTACPFQFMQQPMC